MKQTFMGYHATSKKNAEMIISDKFYISEKPNEWLGLGIYFFRYITDAKSWLTYNRFSKKETAIIECKLEVDENKHLDLNDPSQMDMLNKYGNRVLSQLNEDKISLDFDSDEHKACYIHNLYKMEYDVELITYTYKSPRTKKALDYTNSIDIKNFGYNEVQMCTTSNDCIKNKKIICDKEEE